MEKTTIQIKFETLERLKALKNFERQSYDELLNNLIENSEEDSLSEEEINEIQKGLEDVKKARDFLKKLQKKDAEIILNKIYSIRENPYRFLKRLQGEKLWRLRIGDYRAKVDVIVSMNKIIVIRIGHRKNIYD